MDCSIVCKVTQLYALVNLLKEKNKNKRNKKINRSTKIKTLYFITFINLKYLYLKQSLNTGFVSKPLKNLEIILKHV